MRRMNYGKTSMVLRNAAKIIAEQTMQGRSRENGDSPVNTVVSVDGSWQKKRIYIDEWCCYCNKCQ